MKVVAIFLSCLILRLQGEATRLSNAAYSVGSMLMELSLAANNLAQAGSGNGGPMLSAQTGFLSLDGSHSHVTNRVPGPPPPDLMSRSYRIPLSGGIPLTGETQQSKFIASSYSSAGVLLSDLLLEDVDQTCVDVPIIFLTIISRFLFEDLRHNPGFILDAKFVILVLIVI